MSEASTSASTAHAAEERESGVTAGDPSARTNQLISVVCHDLRSPLSSIVMGAGFLKKSLAATEGMAPEKRILESVLRSADRLASLIADLHDLAHLETGRFEVEKHRLEVGSMLQTALTMHGELSAKKGVKLESVDVASSTYVECDRDRVLQVFRELLENAIRYSPANGTVRIGVEVTGGRASFTVSDDGPGMSPERLEHAFDHYWHAAQSPRDGTGFGLALVRGIAVAHGGGATVDSGPGKGTRVGFWLPAEA